MAGGVMPTKPGWLEVLSIVLPDEAQTDLLRTCLLSGDPGRLWKRYLLGGGEFTLRVLTEIFTGKFGGNSQCPGRIDRYS